MHSMCAKHSTHHHRILTITSLTLQMGKPRLREVTPAVWVPQSGHGTASSGAQTQDLHAEKQPSQDTHIPHTRPRSQGQVGLVAGTVAQQAWEGEHCRILLKILRATWPWVSCALILSLFPQPLVGRRKVSTS